MSETVIVEGFEVSFEQAGDQTWSGIFLGTGSDIILAHGSTLEAAIQDARDGLESLREYCRQKGRVPPSPTEAS